MKRYTRANGILAFSLVFFLGALWMKQGNLWSEGTLGEWVYFIAQSCFIGCVADFIAVEALFRKPFGFPIKPLIPANRARIIQKVGEMNHSLLNRENLLAKVSTFSVTDAALPWLKERRESISQRLARSGAAYMGEFLDSHREEIQVWGRSESRKWIPVFISFLRERLQREMNREEWLLRLLEEGKRKAADPALRRQLAEEMKKAGDREKKGFLGNIGYKLGKWFGAVDYDALAEAALEALVEELEAWKRKDHPFHQELLSQWDLLVERFLREPATLEALQEFGKGLFESFPLERRIDDGLTGFQKLCEGGELADMMLPFIRQGFSRVEESPALCREIDTMGRDLLSEILTYEHGFLHDTMMEVLESLRDEELNEFIESKVHHELEGIRINGAVVGLAAGLVFYGFLTWAWIPLVGKILY